MSVQESKIREELELDVENNLEEEIKEEIYHLALKLHRLYQHQKQKIESNRSFDDHHRMKMLSEVNINIKLEGGTTIQIKEIKKEARGKVAGPTARKAKFNWARSLRSEGSDVASDDLGSTGGRRARGVLRAGDQECVTRAGWKY